MKKLWAALLLCLAVMALMLCAYAETSGDFEYKVLDDGTAMITKYTGKFCDGSGQIGWT